MNSGKICVSVCAETSDDFIQNIVRTEDHADIIELRFDCLSNDEIRTVFAHLPATKKTYLFTFRPLDQGGKRPITHEERLKFWELEFWDRRYEFMVDIEYDRKFMFEMSLSNIDHIVSFHDFEGTPGTSGSVSAIVSDPDARMIKIAVQTNDVTDSIAIWKLLDRAKSQEKQIIPIAMGEAGKWTRIMGLAHGAFMTYAALGAGEETAPGQITARELIETYRVKDLDLDTEIFGVIGDPVAQSLSTFMHNPAFAAGGVNAVFIPFLVSDLNGFMRRMVRPESREIELNFGGFSVTMPHKQSILKYLDAIDPTAEKIRAVNTVKIDGDKLTGYNTDAHGFITPLTKKFGNLADAAVAVFGAGGAARACVFALKRERADVTVFARDPKKLADFGVEFQVKTSAIEKAVVNGFDIVVDTTPLGMKGRGENDSLFTADQLSGVKFVYDLVTKPGDTPIMREAKFAGISTIGGFEMLIEQGAEQFEIWTGRPAPREIMKASALARLRGE